MTTKKFALIILVLLAISPLISAEKIVLLAIDDFQVWWLEDIQEQIVQMHMDNQIPVTLGVIPSGIEDPWGAGDRIIDRIQRWDANPTTEVAQHGYDHQVFLEGVSYEEQYNQLKKGNDLMKSVGVTPKSFVPPFGSADSTTVQVLKDLNFNTLYNPVWMSPDSDDDLLIIQNQVLLTQNEDEGKDSVFKDYNSLVSEIDSKIEEDGVALVLYHMQDFDSDSGEFNTAKADQIVDYADRLKSDGYTLMTVNQYYQHINDNQPPVEIDNDNDGYNESEDCDDFDSSVHPGAEEICDNNIDDNCDGKVDSEDEGCGGNNGEGIVLLAMDDFQVWWLEDIQEQIVQMHMDNQIPVTLGVIPAGIEDQDGAGDRIIDRIQRWDANPTTEVAQHGYDHQVILSDYSIGYQYLRIKKGNDLMRSVGLEPKSFIPPYGEANDDTIKSLEFLNINTLYTPINLDLDQEHNLLVLDGQLQLCENYGVWKDCVFKDYSTLTSELDSKIEEDGVVLLLYHMQDFDMGNGDLNTAKADQIVDYADRLKSDGYTLMTVNQYYEYVKSKPNGVASSSIGSVIKLN